MLFYQQIFENFLQGVLVYNPLTTPDPTSVAPEWFESLKSSWKSQVSNQGRKRFWINIIDSISEKILKIISIKTISRLNLLKCNSSCRVLNLIINCFFFMKNKNKKYFFPILSFCYLKRRHHTCLLHSLIKFWFHKNKNFLIFLSKKIIRG